MTLAIYRNPFTFLEAPWYRDLPDADVVISGIPFDLATSGRSGARSGPGAVRQASARNLLDASWVNEASAKNVIQRIREIIADRPAYLTFDIDCLDPAFAPGTGTPVAGGLTSDRATQIIRGLKGLDIRGMDVVEVAPAYDHAEITSLAAATLALEMLYILAEKSS